MFLGVGNGVDMLQNASGRNDIDRLRPHAVRVLQLSEIRGARYNQTSVERHEPIICDASHGGTCWYPFGSSILIHVASSLPPAFQGGHVVLQQR